MEYSKCNYDKHLENLQVQSKDLVDFNIINVAVGTTGYKGGDTGHGGRTIFTIENESSTDMRIAINNGDYYNVDKFSLAFGGDAELTTFIQALEFALQVLKPNKPWYKRIFNPWKKQ